MERITKEIVLSLFLISYDIYISHYNTHILNTQLKILINFNIEEKKEYILMKWRKTLFVIHREKEESLISIKSSKKKKTYFLIFI